MADLFGDWVPDTWIQRIFEACEAAPQHRYLFLTKNPKRYAELVKKRVLPKLEKYWYGSTITSMEKSRFSTPHRNTFLSIEPIIEKPVIPKTYGGILCANWVIVGAETGNRKGKVVPKREWIEEIFNECVKYGVPLFMKNSLADTWGEPLIQEYPWEEYQ